MDNTIPANVQSLVYNHLVNNIFGIERLITVIERRVSKLLHRNNSSETVSTPEIKDALLSLKRLSSEQALKVLKSWANSWATSRRYHEAIIFPCFFVELSPATTCSTI